jgi:hypothetical protein
LHKQKLTLEIKKNPLSGDWFCMCKEFPMQTYICKSKKGAEKMAEVVQEHFDKYGHFNKNDED